MGRITQTKYSCDDCGKSLRTCNNQMQIVTDQTDPDDTLWSRFEVNISYSHGMHNDSDTDSADLCQTCAVKLLTDALSRVKGGERATAGSESIEQRGWK